MNNFLDTKNYDLISEDKAVMCQDKYKRNKIKKIDEYGYNKLKCEILIRDIFKNKFFTEKYEKENKLYKNNFQNKIDFSNKKYLFIRLPDVIGPFDESYRIWCYLEWIKYSHIQPIEFEKVDIVRKLSFVSRDDVNHTILNIIFEVDKNLNYEKIFNSEFNISFDEIITLKELIDLLYCIMKKKNKDLEDNGYFYIISEDCAKTFLPSVTVGSVSNIKAKENYVFKQSENFVEYLEKTVNFFENCGKFYEKEFNQMKRELPKNIKNILKKIK